MKKIAVVDGYLSATTGVKTLACVALLLLLGLPAAAYAAPPDLRTPAPVIYLADNLDEQDGLGWCIDTRGRGFSDRLHAHSCKPRGGDVQFRYDEAARRIASATFAGKCAALLAPAAAGAERHGLLPIAQKTSSGLRTSITQSAAGDGVPPRRGSDALPRRRRRQQVGRAVHVARSRTRAMRLYREEVQAVAHQESPALSV